jgi:hypothetical protein
VHGTATGIPEITVKNTKWGTIATKYNCPRIQEYVDGDRTKDFLRKAAYLLVEILPY